MELMKPGVETMAHVTGLASELVGQGGNSKTRRNTAARQDRRPQRGSHITLGPNSII